MLDERLLPVPVSHGVLISARHGASLDVFSTG